MDSLAGTDDRGRRESLVMLQRAVRGRWKLADEWYEELPKVAAGIAASPKAKHRTRLAALRLLHLMSRDGLDAAIALERLHAEGEMVEQLVALTYKIVEARPPTKQVVSIQTPRDNGGDGRPGGDEDGPDA